MGEAKRRGDFEKRKTEAIEKANEDAELRRKAKELNPPRVIGSPVLSLLAAGIMVNSSLYK